MVVVVVVVVGWIQEVMVIDKTRVEVLVVEVEVLEEKMKEMVVVKDYCFRL